MVKTRIFSEKLAPPEIPIRDSDSTYYIVDPGMTNSSCNPRTDFLPKVIIVSSPDSRQWGKHEFTKYRDAVIGGIRFYPVWSEQELLLARPILRLFLSCRGAASAEAALVLTVPDRIAECL
jgi:hypothetical protein